MAQYICTKSSLHGEFCHESSGTQYVDAAGAETDYKQGESTSEVVCAVCGAPALDLAEEPEEELRVFMDHVRVALEKSSYVLTEDLLEARAWVELGHEDLPRALAHLVDNDWLSQDKLDEGLANADVRIGLREAVNQWGDRLLNALAAVADLEKRVHRMQLTKGTTARTCGLSRYINCDADD